jgi:hypothetical protein
VAGLGVDPVQVIPHGGSHANVPPDHGLDGRLYGLRVRVHDAGLWMHLYDSRGPRGARANDDHVTHRVPEQLTRDAVYGVISQIAFDEVDGGSIDAVQ